MHRRLAGAALAVAILVPVASLAGPTSLDTTFGNQGRIVLGTYGVGGDMAMQPDGKTVLTFAGNGFWVARFGTNGFPDLAFGGGDAISVSAFAPGGGTPTDVVVQPDGYIVAAGIANPGTANMAFAVARFEPDGDLDPTFGSGGVTVTEISPAIDRGRAVALAPDGKIVLVGDADVAGSLAFAVVRYESDGTPDATFGSGGIVVNELGPDADFLEGVVVQPDGAIIAIGTHRDPTEQMVVVRYELDGDLDPTFGAGGMVISPTEDPSSGQDAVIAPDGKILVAGNGDFTFAVVRLDASGALDPNFGDGGGRILKSLAAFSVARDIVIQPNGSIVVAGELFNLTGPSDGIVIRLLPDGRVDPTFGAGAVTLDINGRQNMWQDVALQADGKIVVGGDAEVAPSDYRVALARYEGVGPCEPGPAPDGDGDGVCDAGDPCHNVAGARDFAAGAQLEFQRVIGDDEPGNDRLEVDALFDLPSPGDFATLNPLAQGARVIVYRADGSPAIDAALPGGAFAGGGAAGWKFNGSGTRWRYVDKTGSPANGITRVDIRDRAKSAPARVQVAVRGKKGTYPVRAEQYPLSVTLQLGDAAAGAAGLCGERSFSQ